MLFFIRKLFNKTHDFIEMIRMLIKKQDVISENKKVEACFADKDLSSWTGLGRTGHVQITTLHSMSHISDLEINLWRKFMMIM